MVKIFKWLLCGFPNGFFRSKVDDRIDLMLFQNLCDKGAITHVACFYDRGFASDLRQPLRNRCACVGKVV
mgnify:CR=1 FL=1